jgi:hypothetical protein
MIKATKQNEVGLWEAWIEFDSITPGYFGMLYVLGEVQMKKKNLHPFLIKSISEGDTKQLVLNIDESLLSSGANMQEVSYSQPLLNIDQYASIVIYAGEELIEQIEDIEVLV